MPPIPQAGDRSLQAFWLGGAATVPSATTQPGDRSFLAFWIGGASIVGEPPPPTGNADVFRSPIRNLGGMMQ
jgi:hypothetical protein